MSASRTLEEVAEQALKEKNQALQEKDEAEARIKHLQAQLAQLMRERQRNLRDIPEFEGKLGPDEFLDWLRTVERVFDYKDIPEDKRVKLVASKLRKYASIWWANLVAKRARKGKDKIRSWDQMRNKLKDKFLPPHYLQDNYLKLHPYSSLDVLSSLAHKVELQRKSKGTSPLSKPYAQTAPQRTHSKPNEEMRCFRCQGLGHIISECPNERIVTLAESQVPFEELEEEEEKREVHPGENMEEVEEGSDEGELLMIRRALDQEGTVPTAHDHLLITPLLKDSQHALPQEMSHGSPPQRSNPHKVDLSPSPTPTKFSWETKKRAKEIPDLHAHIREKIEKPNNQAMYQANKHEKDVPYQSGGLVWTHLREARFPSKRKSKLMPRSDGPFEIIEKIDPNAYKVELPPDPGGYGVSLTFTVADTNPYYAEKEESSSLRPNSSQAGEDDGDHPRDMSKSMHVQSSSKEAEYLAASPECTSAGPTRNWSSFVTLVS